MQIHYISFRKRFPRAIRVEFAITAGTRREARLIAEYEAAHFAGYRYQGVN